MEPSALGSGSPPPLPAAGGPSSPVELDSRGPLATARAAAFALLADWPQLQELQAEAASISTSCHDRRRHAASSLAACTRAEMTAALIAQRTRRPGVDLRTEVDAAVVVLGGQLRHASLRALHDGGLRLLADSWRLADRDVQVIAESLRSVIGPQAVFGPSSLTPPATLIPDGVVSDFALAPLLFGEALAAG